MNFSVAISDSRLEIFINRYSMLMSIHYVIHLVHLSANRDTKTYRNICERLRDYSIISVFYSPHHFVRISIHDLLCLATYVCCQPCSI